MKTREQILERIKTLEAWYDEDRALAIEYQKEGDYDTQQLYVENMSIYLKQISVLKWVLEEEQ